MDEKKLFDELRTIKKLLAMNTVGEKGLREQVRVLTGVGLTPTEIADITGKTANLIRVTKSSLKKREGKKKENSYLNEEEIKDEL